MRRCQRRSHRLTEGATLRNMSFSIGRTVAFAAALSACTSYSAGAVTITEYALPSGTSTPYSIVPGSDGALWFPAGNTSGIGGSIWRVTTGGAFTEHPLPFPP